MKTVWKLAVLLVLMMLAFSYAMFQGGFVSWFLFYSFLPFALYALALFAYPLKDFSGNRELQRHQFYAGESMEAVITLDRRYAFPLYYLIAGEQFNHASEAPTIHTPKKMVLPAFRKKIRFNYMVEDLPRGEHTFGGMHVKTGDPLGLIETEWFVPIEEKIIVYPAHEEIEYRPGKIRLDHGMVASSERIHRDSSMSVGVREYQPGDRFSWINWKATAKRNEFMTKEFEQGQSHEVMVVMDCTQNSYFETVVSFTSSLLQGIHKKGAGASLLTLAPDRAFFSLNAGEPRLPEIMYHLAKIRDRSTVSFGQILEREAFLLRKHQVFVLVTAKIDEELLEKAGLLALRNGGVTIFFIKNERETLTKAEQDASSAAIARGIKVVPVYKGRFKEAFTEVKRS